MTLSRAKSITSDEAYTPYGVYRKAGEVGESVRYAPSMRCERIDLPPRSECLGFPPRHVCAAERCLLLTYLLKCERIVLWRGSPRRAVASGFTHRTRVCPFVRYRYYDFVTYI